MGGTATCQRPRLPCRGAGAKDCGIDRLVLASSLQAISGYPDERQVRVEDPPRPANLYGATKAWVEALGSWVAATSSTTVVLLRIGNFSPSVPDPAVATPRDVAAWLSPGDAVRMALVAVDGRVASGRAATSTAFPPTSGAKPTSATLSDGWATTPRMTPSRAESSSASKRHPDSRLACEKLIKAIRRQRQAQ